MDPGSIVVQNTKIINDANSFVNMQQAVSNQMRALADDFDLHVEALHGLNAKPRKNEKLTVDAIVVAQDGNVQAPAAQFVETIIPLTGDQNPVSILKDTTVVGIEHIEYEGRLPEVALLDVAAPTPTRMATWNAHLDVKSKSSRHFLIMT